MRKIAAAAGCLVVAAYATVAEAAMGNDHAAVLVAKCHLGDQGYVVFRQQAEFKEESKKEKGPEQKKKKAKKGKLAQQNAIDADELEHTEAAIADDGALNEKRVRESESESEDEKEHLSGSENEDERVQQETDEANAEAEEKQGKKINISCSYEEENTNSAKAKAKA